MVFATNNVLKTIAIFKGLYSGYNRKNKLRTVLWNKCMFYIAIKDSPQLQQTKIFAKRHRNEHKRNWNFITLKSANSLIFFNITAIFNELKSKERRDLFVLRQSNVVTKMVYGKIREKITQGIKF